MFKGRTILLIIISGLLAVSAAWVANSWLQKQNRPAQQVEVVETNQVMTAALTIPYGQKVEPQHLKAVEVPVSFMPKGSAQTPEELIGKIAQAEILEGEILMNARFAEHLEGSTLASLITPTMRAITVRVNDVVGVAGFLLPGNRVDILASRIQKKRAYTRTLLTDLKILAVDQKATTNEKDPVIVRAVTLEVSPQQAEIIVKARGEGPIQLSLRNPQDNIEVAKAPKRRARTSSTVTIIRGTSVQNSKVSL
ncbi:Flp pilus assembly protein CpaB [Amphritea sp. HPY]|uniref:Flp pilus assembly protein CpaB n=1 Tax=Amphritea sp. HPY TaxID=3421652 RepID=UPI003D7EAABC